MCTGTRAIVRALPSGHISEEVWEVVGSYRNWQPSKKEIWPILLCGMKEEFRVCREIQCLVWPGIMDQMVSDYYCHMSQVRFENCTGNTVVSGASQECE